MQPLLTVVLCAENVSANSSMVGRGEFVMSVPRFSSETTDARSELIWALQLLSPSRNILNQRRQMLSFTVTSPYTWQMLQQTATAVTPLSYSCTKQCLLWSFCLAMLFTVAHVFFCQALCLYILYFSTQCLPLPCYQNINRTPLDNIICSKRVQLLLSPNIRIYEWMKLLSLELYEFSNKWIKGD